MENIVQDNVDSQLDNQDRIPMEVENHNDFQVDVAEAKKNSTNCEVATISNATPKRCYPSGKELFYNFGDDIADDEWFNNKNPPPLFWSNYSQEEMEANMPKKRIEKPKKGMFLEKYIMKTNYVKWKN